MSKETIGRTVLVDLPRLRLHGIAAKIDTGAYYCTLHCDDIKVKKEDGNQVLYVKLLDSSHSQYRYRTTKIYKFSEVVIKNSFGEEEIRYAIETTVKIHNRRINTLVSFTDRANMKYPMLIGRRLLKNKFVVDVSINETGEAGV